MNLQREFKKFRKSHEDALTIALNQGIENYEKDPASLETARLITEVFFPPQKLTITEPISDIRVSYCKNRTYAMFSMTMGVIDLFPKHLDDQSLFDFIVQTLKSKQTNVVPAYIIITESLTEKIERNTDFYLRHYCYYLHKDQKNLMGKFLDPTEHKQWVLREDKIKEFLKTNNYKIVEKTRVKA